ncbi:MAG: hypothetical protein R3E13_02160 [Alphaproteobacteria bacterium]
MRLIVLILILLFSGPLAYAETQYKALTDGSYEFPRDCKKAFDEFERLRSTDFESQISDLEEEKTDKLSEELGYALLATFVLGNYVDDCADIDPRYYDHEDLLCRATLTNPRIAKFYELIKDNKDVYTREHSYCDKAFKKDNFRLFFHIFYDFAAGVHGNRSYSKALLYLDKAIEKDPVKGQELLFFAVPLHRYGGYGLKKDETKAFSILQELSNAKDNENLMVVSSCELSLYYRNGIGTEIDIDKADELLALYKKYEPSKECQFAKFDFLLGK